MQAMILAAGQGKRMRPLTDQTPKPLLKVGGQSLIEYHLSALKKAGIGDIVINLGHLGRQISNTLGDGHRYGVQIEYSDEGDSPLETAGAIKHALHRLGQTPFLVINSDIWTDYPFSELTLKTGQLAHIVLVNNPDHHPEGDFALDGDRISLDTEHRLTFSGIGIYSPRFFAPCPDGAYPMAPLLKEAAQHGRLGGTFYPGQWRDIGTPPRLVALDKELTPA